MTSVTRNTIRLLLLSSLLAVFCMPATAQRKYPVQMRLEPLSIRGRSGGPIPVRIKLEYNSNQMLEGDLLLEIYNSVNEANDLAATIRYEGIVLQGTDYIFEAILPPLEHSYNKQYQIISWFDTESGRIPLSLDPKNPAEPRELLSIGPHQRATLICSCSGEIDYLKPSANRLYLNHMLSLENYNPVAPQAEDDDVEKFVQESMRILNYTTSWDAYDLPEDPLRLCCFDIVLLADGALSRLDDAQLEALKIWSEAGGSICILPNDRNLKKTHLQFLQTLFERNTDPDLHLSLTDKGTLLVISSQNEPIVNRHFGLGRVTLLPGLQDITSRLKDADLGSVVGHLWKVRSDSPVYQGQPWRTAKIEAVLAERNMALVQQNGNYKVGGMAMDPYGRVPEFPDLESLAAHYGLGNELPPRPGPLTSACETGLMPFGVEMVPAWVIGLLLVAYVVTIGPVDYLVLGFFRLRKFTWLLFPLVTAVFTALTIIIAHRYMASSETGGRLTIIDLVDDGRPVRQTDVQMHFYGQQTTLTKERNHSFVIPAQMIVGSDQPYAAPQGPRPITAGMDYSGRFPQAFSTTLQLRQWEPQMTRSLTLTPDLAGIPELPWDDFNLVGTESGRTKLRSLLATLQQSGAQVDAIVLNGRNQFPLFPGNGFMFSKSSIDAGQKWLTMDTWRRQQQLPPGDAVIAVGLLDSSARTGTRDFFSIVSQVSPHGSASLEDLPIFDLTDNGQWLLIVAVKQQLHTQVLRRVYHQNEAQVPELTPARTPQ